MQHEFYTIQIGQRRQETEDSITVDLEIPENLREIFSYKAGQYVTLQYGRKGSLHQKAYSLSSSPLEDKWSITIRQFDGDAETEELLQILQPGNEIRCSNPTGHFTLKTDEEKEKCYYLFAAGSGITPIRSIIVTILESEPKSSVFLLYGNRTPESTIFRDELEALERRYEGQFTMELLYSRIDKGNGFLGGLFKKKSSTEIPGMKKGRIDQENAAGFLQLNDCFSATREYFICGPAKMISAMTNFLLAQGVKKEQIHMDHYTAHEEHGEVSQDHEGPATLIAHLFGERIEIPIEDKSVLDTLQDAGYDPPFSCQSGACSTCMARIIEGSATMEMCYALDDDEIADGFVLTCQAHPTTSTLEITYEV